MFLHFNMATFQDREWGDPLGPIEVFGPTNLDTDQWAQAALAANMTFGCLTTKHHDGFCIWPTETTADHAQIDVVRAYADSFREQGLKVGLYYSILDLRADIRHHNITTAKIDLIRAQLTELLIGYGDIDLLIFDGWDAPWSRITYEEVPFHDIYQLVKRLQPNCLVCDLNASQYPADALYYTDIKAFEQNAGQMIPDGNALPALSCVTLTDGWFWKTTDDGAELKSTEQIVHGWLIPQNNQCCNLLLNAPPNREGRLAPNVVERLKEIGRARTPGGSVAEIGPATPITTRNLATGHPIHASTSADTVGPDVANDGNFRSAWRPDQGSTHHWLEIDLPSRTFNTIALTVEDVASCTVQAWTGEWTAVATVESPRTRSSIISCQTTAASRLRLLLTGPSPAVYEVGVYNEPRH
jgi:alpha-L-fucosidase